MARRRDERRGYADRLDRWGQGLTADATLIGLVGEEACARYLNRRLGLSLSVVNDDLPAGDGGVDFTAFGYRLQVKTRTRRGTLLVRRATETGTLLPLRWHFCVCATWELGQGREANQLVTLDGWVRRDSLALAGDYENARRGAHMNLEAPDAELEGMGELVSYLRARQLGGHR